MNVASLELSKKLFELSGWKDTDKWYGQWYGKDFEVGIYDTHVDEQYPAYDAGYLLRKLPDHIEPNPRDKHGAFYSVYLTRFGEDKYHAYYYDVDFDPEDYLHEQMEDTPEDALALLAIKLHEEGVL